MSISQTTTPIVLDDGTRSDGYVALPDSGAGPGLLLLPDRHGCGDHAKHQANLYAEEGWVVVVPDLYAREPAATTRMGYDDTGRAAAERRAGSFDTAQAARDAAQALTSLLSLPACSGKAGLLGFDTGATTACLLAGDDTRPACVVAYDPHDPPAALQATAETTIPVLLHLAGAPTPDHTATTDNPLHTIHYYDGVAAGFDNRNHPAYNRPAQMMAKSRTLACLRAALGPRYDLASLWEHHLYTEFAERDVDDSMVTMVDEPYVFVVPTVTGGTGKRDLHRWYSDHFHFQNPEDTRIVPISRTIGTDRLVDEFIFCFTHDRVMDWILPGIDPTNKPIEIPMIAVVNFRGDKLYHEHIWWDQASVLVQAGLLDPRGLPVTGADQAAAMQDETLPRNRLIPGWG